MDRSSSTPAAAPWRLHFVFVGSVLRTVWTFVDGGGAVFRFTDLRGAGYRYAHRLSLETRAVHLGLFGGSFDPPHICHTLFCLYVLEMTDVEKILWIPCVEHPFGKGAASYEHRMAMSRLAAESFGERVEVSDLERRLPRPSYTIHTVEALRREQPDARLSLLIGSDLVSEIHRWERSEELRRLVDLVVVPRGGCHEKETASEFALPRLSSTDVREALAAGEPVDRYVVPPVLRYIERHGLYRE
jgi:nicotinate-nucleotide adenylyltransferase